MHVRNNLTPIKDIFESFWITHAFYLSMGRWELLLSRKKNNAKAKNNEGPNLTQFLEGCGARKLKHFGKRWPRDWATSTAAEISLEEADSLQKQTPFFFFHAKKILSLLRKFLVFSSWLFISSLRLSNRHSNHFVCNWKYCWISVENEVLNFLFFYFLCF